jgi:hypothetical protein
MQSGVIKPGGKAQRLLYGAILQARRAPMADQILAAIDTDAAEAAKAAAEAAAAKAAPPAGAPAGPGAAPSAEAAPAEEAAPPAEEQQPEQVGA